MNVPAKKRVISNIPSRRFDLHIGVDIQRICLNCNTRFGKR